MDADPTRVFKSPRQDGNLDMSGTGPFWRSTFSSSMADASSTGILGPVSQSTQSHCPCQMTVFGEYRLWHSSIKLRHAQDWRYAEVRGLDVCNLQGRESLQWKSAVFKVTLTGPLTALLDYVHGSPFYKIHTERTPAANFIDAGIEGAKNERLKTEGKD